MKNKTVIKEKKSLSKQEKKNLFFTILFSIISLGIGFLIAFFGKGKSYIETELITAIVTLFGFGLTATVFIYQAFDKKQSMEVNSVLSALSKTLLLTLCLVIISLILDFVVSLEISNVFEIIINSLKYAFLIYSMICQFDILNSFIVIIRRNKKDDSEKNE